MKKSGNILLILLICFGLFGCSNKTDNTKLADSEVFELFEKEDYKFVSNNISSNIGCFLMNQENTIVISLVETYTNEKMVVKTIAFANSEINMDSYRMYVNEDFYLKSSYDKMNASEGGQAQQKGFNNWLDEIGLTEKQIISLMNYYRNKVN